MVVNGGSYNADYLLNILSQDLKYPSEMLVALHYFSADPSVFEFDIVIAHPSTSVVNPMKIKRKTSSQVSSST